MAAHEAPEGWQAWVFAQHDTVFDWELQVLRDHYVLIKGYLLSNRAWLCFSRTFTNLEFIHLNCY